MPLLYADSSTKEEAEVAVKAAVLGAGRQLRAFGVCQRRGSVLGSADAQTQVLDGGLEAGQSDHGEIA